MCIQLTFSIVLLGGFCAELLTELEHLFLTLPAIEDDNRAILVCCYICFQGQTLHCM